MTFFLPLLVEVRCVWIVFSCINSFTHLNFESLQLLQSNHRPLGCFTLLVRSVCSGGRPCLGRLVVLPHSFELWKCLCSSTEAKSSFAFIWGLKRLKPNLLILKQVMSVWITCKNARWYNACQSILLKDRPQLTLLVFQYFRVVYSKVSS